MLVLDVLDNWVPASVVVDLVAVTWGINNVQAQTNSVFLDDVGDGLDFSGRSYWLIGGESSFGVNQVGRKDGVDQCRLSETGLTCEPTKSECAHICYITTFHVLYIPTQITLNWKPRFKSLRSICDVILSKPTWLRGYTDCWAACLSWIVAIIARGQRDPSVRC